MIRRLVLARESLRLAVSLAAVGLALHVSTAGATSVCRWLDESGRTQVAEVVPDRYKKVATCSDSQKYEISPEQRRAAAERVAEDSERARQAAAKLPPERASNPARPAAQPNTKRPTGVVTEATDCPTWWRIYDESVECFGPYRTARGATKVEGFDKCNVIPNPELTCGPRSN